MAADTPPRRSQITRSFRLVAFLFFSCLGVSGPVLDLHQLCFCACAITASAEGCNLTELACCKGLIVSHNAIFTLLFEIMPFPIRRASEERVRSPGAKCVGGTLTSKGSFGLPEMNAFTATMRRGCASGIGKEENRINGLISKIFLCDFDAQSASLSGIH